MDVDSMVGTRMTRMRGIFRDKVEMDVDATAGMRKRWIGGMVEISRIHKSVHIHPNPRHPCSICSVFYATLKRLPHTLFLPGNLGLQCAEVYQLNDLLEVIGIAIIKRIVGFAVHI